MSHESEWRGRVSQGRPTAGRDDSLIRNDFITKHINGGKTAEIDSVCSPMFFNGYERSFTLACITFIVLSEKGVIPVLRNVGFYCGDPKISHKFGGDTIHVKWLLGVSFFLPLIVMILTAWSSKKQGGNSKSHWLKRGLIWYRDYLTGFLLIFTAVVFLKNFVGEPRPHFLDTCRPKEAVNCSSLSVYIPLYECSNKNVSAHRILDAYRSFPSGHAAFSFYMLGFLTYFMKKRMRKLNPNVLILLTACLFWASLCALTRITDHRHHWWDVLTGTILGSGIAYYTGVAKQKEMLPAPTQ